MGMNKFRRTTQINGPLTIGYSDTGYDVTMYTATAGCNLLLDESTDELDLSLTTEIQAAHKLQFRDTAIYLNSSVDGQLDIDADNVVDITATSINATGQFNISGCVAFADDLAVAGSLTVGTSANLAGELNLTGSLNTSSSVSLGGGASALQGMAVTGSVSIGNGTNNAAFASDGILTMAGTGRVIVEKFFPAKDISCNIGNNWTAGSHTGASTYAWDYGNSGTAGCAYIGLSIPSDMDTTATGSVDVLWNSGCVAAANASMHAAYHYFGVTDATPGDTGNLTGVEASGGAGANTFEYTNVTDALTIPSASTKLITIGIVYTPNTAQTSTGSTFQLNGLVVKYISNKLGTAT